MNKKDLENLVGESMEDMGKINECPFCGYNEIGSLQEVEKKVVTLFHVECEECGGCGPRSVNEDIAIERWNGRV